jgi:hypothetical protein
LALSLVLGCSRGQPEKGAAVETPSLRLAVVTDLKGYLEPCGCTSDPLGGIDRLAAQVRTLREGKAPVLLLAAGDLLFDTAELEPSRIDQATRNAKTLVQILNRLQVSAVLPGPSDRAQSAETLAALRELSDFRWLAMDTEVDVLKTDAGALRVAVVGVRPGPEPVAVADAVAALLPNTDLSIVLVDGSRRDANRIGAIDGVDFVIQGGLDEDEPMPPRRAGNAWVLHASRQGQGLTVVDIILKTPDAGFADRSEWSRSVQTKQLDQQIADLAAKIANWEKSGEVQADDLTSQRDRLDALRKARTSVDAAELGARENTLSATWIPLSKSAPRDPQVEKLMREHDKAVNQANRIAFAELEPPPLGPGDIAYVGSPACSACHREAYSWWRGHGHGNAYLTLQEANKEFNLDCVGCHVTGYQAPGGSTVTHNMNGALVNVGCESCHGPGAAHSKDPEKFGILRETPESTCVQCHNSQHSDLFDYEGYKRTLVVPGHGLPAAVR